MSSSSFGSFGLGLCAALLCGCPGEDSTKPLEPLTPPASAGSGTSSEAEAQSLTAGDIEKAVEEAAQKIDSANADAELEKLEQELGDGK